MRNWRINSIIAWMQFSPLCAQIHPHGKPMKLALPEQRECKLSVVNDDENHWIYEHDSEVLKLLSREIWLQWNCDHFELQFRSRNVIEKKILFWQFDLKLEISPQFSVVLRFSYDDLWLRHDSLCWLSRRRGSFRINFLSLSSLLLC